MCPTPAGLLVIINKKKAKYTDLAASGDINGCAGTLLETLFRDERLLRFYSFQSVCVFHLILAQTADAGQGRLKNSRTQHPSLVPEPCPEPHLQPRGWLAGLSAPRVEKFDPVTEKNRTGRQRDDKQHLENKERSLQLSD